MSKWSPPIVEDLTVAAKRGYSASQIARQLSDKYGQLYTRNSVIGKLHRMGGNKLAGHRKQKSKRRAEARASRRAVIPLHPNAALPPAPAPESSPVALLAANNNQCRYFLACGNCCGATVYRRSFCSFHYSRCYPVAINIPRTDNMN